MIEPAVENEKDRASEQLKPWELYRPNSELLRILPLELIHLHQILPIRLSEDKLVVASKQPLSASAQNELRLITALEPQAEIWDSLTWERFYTAYRQDEPIFSQPATRNSSRQVANDEDNGEEIIRLTEAILYSAWRRRASDIHLEPYRNGLLVRLRIDGLLQEYTYVPEERAVALVSRLKILAQMNVAQKYEPQDGHLEVELEDQVMNLRVATMPVYRGEKLVLRFLYREVIELSLPELGLASSTEKQVKNLLSRPHGLLLVTGPTGSGKTTTLYAALNHLRSPSRNITSIEDPIEYELPGVNQIAVNMQRGMSFAQGLRGILRQDPDIIMIGEIRDRETADIALRAAITGRLVLSSLHTNDACGAILRLLDMGIEPYVITAALTGVVSQRLVRRLCPHCKQPKTVQRVPWEEISSESGSWGVAEAHGCDSCHGDGYSGRIGIFEILPIDEGLQRLIMQRPELSVLQKYAMSIGWQPLLHDGWRQCLAGTTDITELTRVLCLQESV